MRTDAEALDQLALLWRVANEDKSTLSEYGMEHVAKILESTGRVAR